MLAESHTLQRDYLQSLLSSHSQQALEVGNQIELQNVKYQNQIQTGILVINQNDEEKGTTYKFSNNLEGINSRLSNHKINKSEKHSPEGKMLGKQEHQKFLRHIVQQKRLLNQQKQARKLFQTEEFQKINQQRKQLEEQQKLEKQITKKKLLQQRINRINLQKEKRQTQIKSQNKIIQKLLGQDRLHSKLQKNFIIQSSIDLEQKKRKLAQIRSLHKPITKQDLILHQKKINEHKQKIPKRQHNIDRSKSVNTQVYKSDFYKKAIQQMSQKNKQLQKQKQDKFQKAYVAKQKIKQYQKHIQNNFKPQIDYRLVKQLQNQQKTQIRKSLESQQLKQLGKDYLKYNLTKKRQKPISEPIGTPHNTTSQLNASNRYQNKKFPKTDRISRLPSKQIAIIQPQQQQCQQRKLYKHQKSTQGIQNIYLRKQKQTIIRKRSKSQIQDEILLIRRKQNDLNDIFDEKELDNLYEKILKVKMTIDNKEQKQ